MTKQQDEDAARMAAEVAGLLRGRHIAGVKVDGNVVAFPLAGSRHVLIQVSVTGGVFDLDSKISELVKSELRSPIE